MKQYGMVCIAHDFLNNYNLGYNLPKVNNTQS